MKRIYMEVRYDKAERVWVYSTGRVSWHVRTKAQAVTNASTICRHWWHEYGRLSELRIKGKNGRIQDRRTYGADPRRTKG